MALAAFTGCASHHKEMIDVRTSLVAGDVPAAMTAFEKKKQKKSDLQYLLDRGYMMHVAGRWQESNEAFELAENRAEDLYTKSISSAAASLVTSDLALPYRSTPHELQFIQYYRALNYLALGTPDDALVEARKANEYLSRYAAETQGQEKFRQDAFLQYFTGLLYESRGEANDAIVSMRDAWNRYGEYQEAYGEGAPPWLAPDYFAVAEYMGSQTDLDDLVRLDSTIADRAAEGGADNTVVYFECGFVPYRESVNITLPIFSGSSPDRATTAAKYVSSYSHDIYAYEQSKVKLDHVLSFAFPKLVDIPATISHCELVLPTGETLRAEPAINLAAVAANDFRRRIPGILLKTVARALAKEATRKAAKKEDETLGWIVNMVNVATEQADTRGWLLLPGRIYMLKTELPAGTHELTARFYGPSGELVEEATQTVNISSGSTSFAAFRTFK